MNFISSDIHRTRNATGCVQSYCDAPLLSYFECIRGSYMSAHILSILLKELGEKDKMRGFAEHLIGFPQQV